jgi:hypothetical protein
VADDAIARVAARAMASPSCDRVAAATAGGSSRSNATGSISIDTGRG